MTQPIVVRMRTDRAEVEAARRQEVHAALGMEAGPPATGVCTLDRLHFTVTGMASRADARRLERRLAALDGVEEATVAFHNDSAVVAVLDGRMTSAELDHIIRAQGFRAYELEEEGQTTPQEVRQQRHRGLVINALATAVPALLVLGAAVATRELQLGTERLRTVITNVELLLVAAVFWYGRDLFITMSDSGAGARRELPLGLAAGFAAATSALAFFQQREPYFDVAAVIVAGYHVGAWLESWLHRKAERHFDSLVAVRPRQATVRRGEREFRIAVNDIVETDLIVVGRDELVPVDGVVLSGGCVVDEATVMGAGAAHQKSEGDHVYAGTRNRGDELVVRPERIGAQTVLGRMLDVVERARETRAPVQVQGDKLAAVAAPVALLASGAVFVAWRFQAPDMGMWSAVAPALALLVVMTPWALGWASALPVVAGMTQAAHLGVLMRDAEVLEVIRGLDTMVFEKAGTLTLDRPEVEALEVFGSVDPKESLRLLLAVENQSRHAVREAFLDYAREEFGDEMIADLPTPRTFRSIPGRGIIAMVEDHEVVVGTGALLDEKGIAYDGNSNDEPGSWVYAAVDGKFRARARLFDPLREDSLPTVARAKADGLRPMMVTAEGRADAEKLAATLGIDPTDVRAGIDTTEHGQVVRTLQAAGLRVGVVGSSVNDQQSLAPADAAFALMSGGELPEKPHAVLLLRPGARGVIIALDVARRAFTATRWNLRASLLSMCAAVPAALGFVPPVIAVGLMLATVLAVGLNGLRVL